MKDSMAVNATIVRIYRLILAALLAGSLIFHSAILWESRTKLVAGYGDFIIFYTGAQIVNDGKSAELFNVETQNAYQARFDVPQLDWPLPFNHAPYELVLFLPLARLSYPMAHAIWTSMNLIFLAIMLGWLLPYVESRHRFFVGAAVFAWFPTMEALRLGQDSIMSTILLLAVFVCLKRKRDGLAGICLALGLYKPQLVLPMAGAFFLSRRWRSAVVFSITGLILAAISIGIVGLRGVFDFVAILRSMDEHAFISRPALMPNVRGLTHLMLQTVNLVSVSGIIVAGSSLGLYALCVYLWKREIDVRDPAFDLQFSLTVVTTVLISYHLYSHDLFPLTLSLILFFRYVASGVITHRALSDAFFVLVIILFLPLAPFYLIKSGAFGWAALPILAFYLILVLEIFRRRTGQLPEPAF
jgi:hypothetical protein